MAIEDNKNISLPQTGMNRDLHPVSLTEKHYTFALNVNIESEDGNVGMRSNEHSNMLCLKFDGYKVIGYKNDLATDSTYFFLTNPTDKTSKIVWYKPVDNASILPEDIINGAVDGNEEICGGLQTLIEDSAEDPCLNFSIYHPIKTIEIKTEKCGKCIYWTDGYNPPRYVIVEKALEPDEDGDIWYHYHGYKICGERDENGNIITRDEFISKNGCFLACEKLRVFPLLEQACIEPEQIEFGGSLRAGVYQFAVAQCDEFGNEKTSYSQLSNPVSIFDRQYIRIQDGKWGERTNLGIRLKVTNLDRQVEYYKVAVVQNTVGYNGETQPVLDFFIEGIHPITETTIYYYSDTNNKRTTFEHISLKKPVYNTSRGIVSVDNRLLQYGLTAEKEWNLQPVCSLLGHFLKWQTGIAHEDLYKDGVACSKYVGFMRNEVYPFSIAFKTSTGYKTPAFVLIPPPFKDSRKLMDTESVTYKSINAYAPDCSDTKRIYEWQYTNTAIADPDEQALERECRNEVMVGQTMTVERDFKEMTDIQLIIESEDIIENVPSYLSNNLKEVACNNVVKEYPNKGASDICKLYQKYESTATGGNDSAMEAIDGIKKPDFGTDCENTKRQESIISLPIDLIRGTKENYIYKELKDMDHVSTDFLYVSGGERQDKYAVLFNYDTLEEVGEWERKHYNMEVGEGDVVVGKFLCTEYAVRRQPQALLKAVSDSIFITDSVPCTCGCFIEEPCINPSVSRSDYNAFQPAIQLIGGFIHPQNVWREDVYPIRGGKIDGNRSGRSTGNILDSKYRNPAIRYDVIDMNWPSINVAEHTFSYLSTGIEMDDWKWQGYMNRGTSAAKDLAPTDRDSTNITSEFVGYYFQDKVIKNARFIKITRPKEWDEPDFPEKDKKIFLEALGKVDGMQDAASVDYVRISFWKNIEPGKAERLGQVPMDFKGATVYESDSSVVVNVANVGFKEIGKAFFDRVEEFYVTIESPFVAASWIFTSRKEHRCTEEDDGTEEEKDNDLSAAMVGVSFLYGKTMYPYIFGIREKEVDKIDVKIDSLVFRSTVVFSSQCLSCGDKPLNCAPRPFLSGEFGYWESSELYPANYELYDSSRMAVGPMHKGSNPEAYSKIVSKLTEFYGNPITDDKGRKHFNGTIYGTANTSTVFCQQPIRHYKFPDNHISPFMNSNTRSFDIASEIYPIGVMIDENTINIFLDFAVDSGLITQQQRDTVVGYELYRGDRRLNRSVISTGMAYDMFKYQDIDRAINLYPSYPYNDLGPDRYNYKTGKRSEMIQHPFYRSGNVWYSIVSPDYYFNKPELPTEVCIDGYQRGMSVGNFVEVEDHPKWTILGPKAYQQARTLALTESIATVAAMIADQLQVRSQSAYVGLVGNLSVAMLFASMITTISQTLAKQVVLYGKYRYDWLTTFINNGPRRNYAWYYTSIGYYNSMASSLSEDDYKANRLRGLSTVKEMKQNIYPISDPSVKSPAVLEGKPSESDLIFVNNVDRESSLFVSFGYAGANDGVDLGYRLNYPAHIANYDNSRVQDPALIISEAAAERTTELTKLTSNIASPYMKLCRYRPDQYGTIEDIKWISMGGCHMLKGGNNIVYGGDTYISRFSMKRKFPEFYTNAFRIGDMIPFPYDDYRNVGFPRYFVNYDTGEDMLEATDNNRFNSWTSSAKGTYSFFPNRKSLYNLNAYVGDKYVNGRFYLWFYGIPQFLVESEINCNFRLEGPEPHEWFYPEVGNYIWWTQEKNVSIQRDNDYKISPIYHSRNVLTPSILPATYERKFYDCAYQRPNGVIWSRTDVSENSQTDPWLSYKPMDYHEFPTKNGKLIHLKRIESNQILARFEDQVSLHNAIDVIKERTSPGQAELGTGGLFASRPLEYNTTDLGYSGTQSTEIISSEFGHFWVDVKRAQVFMTDPNGRGLKEVSVGISHWLKRHLPFKILRYGIINIQTGEPMTYEDTDNKFIGLGLTLGWDNRYKRAFITKRDYIPVKEAAYYSYDGGKFTYNGAEVSLKDPSYFEDVSFTIAYSCVKQEWISYYSFCPDYYIEQQNHFQTGLNYALNSEEEGLWSHLLSNRSFQTFYGSTYPFILETPIKEKYNGSILASVEYELEARDYESDIDYTTNRKVGLDDITIYNDTNNSGVLKLIPDEKNNLMQRVMYPRVVNDHTEVIDTEVYGRHKLNEVFNRIDDDLSGILMWNKDQNDIMREVNGRALNFRKRWLDRMRGSWMLMRVRKTIRDKKIIFKWIISEDKIKNR